MNETLVERAERLAREKKAGSTPTGDSLAERAQRLAMAQRPELADTSAGGALEQDGEPGYGGRLVRTVLNAASGIPGVEAVMAGAGSLGSKLTDNPLSYRESLETLREETGRIPTGRRVAGKMLGSVAALPFLPASPLRAGAAFGAADQALAADPIDGSLDALVRAGKTTVGAGVGAAAGKAGEMAFTAGRTMLAKSTPRLLDDLVARRDAASSPLYAKAFAEGQGKPVTPMVEAFVKRPDVAEIVTELQTLREFSGVKATDPKMLDAVYKVLSDRAGLAKRQAEAVTPSRPNVGRFRRRDIKAAQEEGMDAIAGGTVPGPMPSYRDAVSTHAKGSRVVEAAQRGHDALRSTLNRNLPMAKSLKKTSRESLDDAIAQMTPAEREALEQGILGATRGAFGQSVRKSGLPAWWHSADLLRRAGGKQVLLDDLVRVGLLGGGST